MTPRRSRKRSVNVIPALCGDDISGGGNDTGSSLIEMSIVIVIAGLLIGAVVGGQSLMSGARLKNLASEVQNYEAAVINFKSFYEELPGDMTKSYQYWGNNVGCSNNLASAGGDGCNGNGDGNISWQDEQYRAWQFMAVTKLIPGQYSGVSSNIQGGATISINVPKSRFKDGGFSLMSYHNGNLGDIGSVILNIGRQNDASTPSNALFNYNEMYNLDEKIDNGILFGPDSGKLKWDSGADSNGCGTIDGTERCQAFYVIVK